MPVTILIPDQETLTLVRDAIDTKRQMYREEGNNFNEKAEQLETQGEAGAAGHVNMGKNFFRKADKLQKFVDSMPVTCPPELPQK